MNNKLEEKVLFESRKDLIDFLYFHVCAIITDSENVHGAHNPVKVMEICRDVSNQYAYLSFAVVGMNRSSELRAIVMNAYRAVTGKECPLSGRYPSEWDTLRQS